MEMQELLEQQTLLLVEMRPLQKPPREQLQHLERHRQRPLLLLAPSLQEQQEDQQTALLAQRPTAPAPQQELSRPLQNPVMSSIWHQLALEARP